MKISHAKLKSLIEEATVDAYCESEQRVGFLTMIEENIALPFVTCILGIEVTVDRIDLTAAVWMRSSQFAVGVEPVKQFRYSNCRCRSRSRREQSGSRRIAAGPRESERKP